MVAESGDTPTSVVAPPRRIRSFVRRAGRTTPAQRRALDDLLPRFGLATDRRVDPRASFARPAPLSLEIGFGNGETLLAMARDAPERNFLGIEVYDAGVGRVLETLAREQLDNVRVWHADAVAVLDTCIAPASLDEVALFFPDPWPKKRHHKRRIVQLAFASLVCSRLVEGGVWRLATDWQPYAEHMLDVLEATPGLCNLHGPRNRAPRPASRPPTRFEQRGERLGHAVTDLAYRRLAPSAAAPA